MINRIKFSNYKSFKEVQILELKPVTILIGKNSSGKSAVAKLPTLIEGSLSGSFDGPLLMSNDGVELGAEFRDLVYGREIGSLGIALFSELSSLEVEITSGFKDSEFPRIRKWDLKNDLQLSYDDNKKCYQNQGNDTYNRCAFSGFKLDLMLDIDKDGTSESVPNLHEMGITLRTNYIGPFREIPDRTYNVNGTSRINKIGNKGENAYQILIADFLYNDKQLFSLVNEWYKANFDGWGLDINTIAKPDYKIELTRDTPKFSVNLRDVGEGMSQALPLVVSAFMKPLVPTLTIIEQPELHLHPAAHGNLAELFAMSANRDSPFLIETHSQNFILRLRRLVAENKVNRNDIVIYSIEYNEENNTSNLKKIEITDNGSVSYWPDNVFSETLDETMAIRSAQIKKEGHGN